MGTETFWLPTFFIEPLNYHNSCCSLICIICDSPVICKKKTKTCVCFLRDINMITNSNYNPELLALINLLLYFTLLLQLLEEWWSHVIVSSCHYCLISGICSFTCFPITHTTLSEMSCYLYIKGTVSF